MKKKKIITLSAILAIIIAIVFAYQWFTRPTLEQLYFTQNHILSESPGSSYQPLNPYVNNRLYLILSKYHQETGNNLTFETFEDYASQEYEDDGSIRIFNNGKHKEIEKFVEWYYDDIETDTGYYALSNSIFINYNQYIENTYPYVKEPATMVKKIDTLSFAQLDVLVANYYKHTPIELPIAELLTDDYNFITTEQELLYYLQAQKFSQKADETTIYLPFEACNLSYLKKSIISYNQYQYDYGTGKNISLEDIQAYLSQEYEEDGSVRIFNNGKHPDIYDFVMSENYNPSYTQKYTSLTNNETDNSIATSTPEQTSSSPSSATTAPENAENDIRNCQIQIDEKLYTFPMRNAKIVLDSNFVSEIPSTYELIPQNEINYLALFNQRGGRFVVSIANTTTEIQTIENCDIISLSIEGSAYGNTNFSVDNKDLIDITLPSGFTLGSPYSDIIAAYGTPDSSEDLTDSLHTISYIVPQPEQNRNIIITLRFKKETQTLSAINYRIEKLA